MIRLTKTAKIATGATLVSDWEDYLGPGGVPGVKVNVNTSSAGFTKEPPHLVYMVSLHGKAHLWHTTGGNCIYAASSKGFLVIVRGTLEEINLEYATRNGWYIQWVGIEE